jgi:hypothetical protein
MAFWPTTKKQGRLAPPSTPVACQQNSVDRRPVAGKVADRGSPNGLSMVEGISGGGKDVGKLEQGSPAGSEWLGREYSAVRCLGWGRGGWSRLSAVA